MTVRESMIRKLRAIFKDCDAAKKILVEPQIERYAYMSEKLQELEAAIDERGFTEKYKNGENQTGIKKVPEVDIYNVMVKNLAQVGKMLLEFLPDADAKDELAEFLKANRR